MEFVDIFAMIGSTINDILSILSVFGNVILFLNSFSNTPFERYGKIAEWSTAVLVFGSVSQVSMMATENTPEKVGLLFQMAPNLVNGLLVLSFLLLVGSWWVRKIRRNQYKFQ